MIVKTTTVFFNPSKELLAIASVFVVVLSLLLIKEQSIILLVFSAFAVFFQQEASKRNVLVFLLCFLLATASVYSGNEKLISAVALLCHAGLRVVCNRNILISLILVLGIIIAWAKFDLPILLYSTQSILLEMLVCLGIVELFLWFLNKVYNSVVNVSATELFSAFLLYWYDEKTEAAERVLEKIGIISVFENFVFTVSANERKIHYVIPGIHYGLLGGLGSGDLPKKLQQKSSREESYVALHGPATHDMDLVRKVDVERLIEEIVLHSKKSTKKLKMRYTEARYNNATCRIIDFKDFCVVFMSNFPRTTEDMLVDFGRFLRELSAQKLSNPIVVDCHDSDEGELVIVSSLNQYGNDYETALRKALEKIEKENYEDFSSGWIKVENPGVSGIGSNGISLCAFERKKDIILLVSADSNSVDCSLREEIENSRAELEAIFGKKVEVIMCTSDTHEVNVVRGKSVPLKDRRFLEVLIDGARSLKRGECSLGFAKFVFAAKVLGNTREMSGLFAGSIGFFITLIVVLIVLMIFL